MLVLGRASRRRRRLKADTVIAAPSIPVISNVTASPTSAPDEIRELIEDLVAISQVADDDEPDDESEQQLMEIVEYVRLGALAVFTEFNPPEKPSPNTPTLH